MAIILKPTMVHAVVANAPRIISVDASASIPTMRTFNGSGAPSGSTLAAGNGKYNASTSGWCCNASLAAAGSGYVVGDVLTASGGTGTALQITVDMVNGSGVIVDFHVSRLGNYSVYPTAAGAATTGGTGSSATLNLNFPAPDYYLDITSPTAPVMYVCTTSGSNSGSVWAKISGGGGTQQFKIVSDAGDYWVCNTFDGTTTGGSAINVAKPWRLRAGTNAITSETVTRGGTAITYTYSYTQVTVSGVSVEYIRNVSVSSTLVESDYVTPPVLPGNIIVAQPLSVVAPTDIAACPWIYMGPEAWAN